ncbi:MAG: alpha/beta hydrolase [Aggregatilineales bacterium]
MIPDKTIPTTKIEIDGITINEAYIGADDAPAIVLLHGWGANIALVWALAQNLAPLGYRVFALDLPGFGESDDPPLAWSVFDYTNFVTRYLDAHQLDRILLFGHSFGGRLGLILAAEHPERITRMVLADSAGLRPTVSATIQLRTSVYKTIRNGLTKIGMGALADQLRTVYNKRYGSADFNYARGVMRETFVNVVNQDLLDYAKRVKTPTLLLWGENDEDTPLWMAKKLEAVMGDAGLVIFKGAGHYSYLENLNQSVKAIDALFKDAQ